MTSTLSPSKSGQSRMSFGLPLRTRNTIVDVYGELLFGKRVLPRCRQAPADGLDVVDVPRERERHDVGVQPVDDGARLAARAAVRHLHGDALAGVREPFRGELLVELAIQLARRIVGHVQDLELARSAALLRPQPHASSATAATSTRAPTMNRSHSRAHSENARRVRLRLRLRPCRARSRTARRPAAARAAACASRRRARCNARAREADHEQRLLVRRQRGARGSRRSRCRGTSRCECRARADAAKRCADRADRDSRLDLPRREPACRRRSSSGAPSSRPRRARCRARTRTARRRSACARSAAPALRAGAPGARRARAGRAPLRCWPSRRPRVSASRARARANRATSS